HRPRRVELGDQVLQRGGAARAVLLGALDVVLVEVEGDHVVVGVALDARDHVAAHLAQADEADLHQRIPSTRLVISRTPAARSPSSFTRLTGSPWLSSVCRSPSACDAIRCRKSPTSGPSPPTSCRKRPDGGPPLWNWPVECR